MTNSSLKIGVFMWYDEKIKQYAEINYKINQIYCNIHGYTLIKSDEKLYDTRKPHWERIPLLLKNFDDFDYLVWIDADAYFYIDSPPITNIINEYPDKIFFFSGDTDIKQNQELACEINSGVFIVKKCDESKIILEKWMDEELFKSPKLSQMTFGNNVWNDQAVLRLMYSENILEIKNNSIIIKYGILQHFNKLHKLISQEFGLKNTPFIFHMAGLPTDRRIELSNEYYADIIINIYKQYINTNIQLDSKVIRDILVNCENKKMLVFGLRYDSELWYNATNKNTFFIENNKKYIDLNKNINSNNVIFYSYSNINVKSCFKLTDNQIEHYPIPQKILDNAPYDIILIDGPNGFDDNCPGRLLPIYWSSKYLSKKSTIIYIDDATRQLEKKCINKYFLNKPKTYFTNRLGTIKINI